MDFSSIITNGYERKARLYPALLLIAPIVAVGVALLSSKIAGLQALLFGVAVCGGAFLLTQLARDAGKRKEKDLFELWGGVPSVAIFRHRDVQLDQATKKRYHKKLSSLVEEAEAPSAEEEENDPDVTDDIYSAWSNFLRSNTRDKNTFNLLFQENINYGYRRNVWGMRSIGIITSLLSIFGSAIKIYYTYQSTAQFDSPSIMAGVFSLCILALWVFCFTADWVRIPANAYAERLMESIDVLSNKLNGENRNQIGGNSAHPH